MAVRRAGSLYGRLARARFSHHASVLSSSASVLRRTGFASTGNRPAAEVELPTKVIPAVLATKENLEPYGVFISNEVHNPGLGIPFYKGSVIEGSNFDFVCNGPPTARTAQIHPRESPEVTWLERHMRMTQMFVGLGNTPFMMVLGVPDTSKTVPDLSKVSAFVIPPGTGLMIHKGTWHDFPVAISKPVTVLTYNSAEVVQALASMKEPKEMDFGDVFKIKVAARLNQKVVFNMDEIKKKASVFH